MEKTAEFNLQEEAKLPSVNVEQKTSEGDKEVAIDVGSVASNLKDISTNISNEMGDKAKVVEKVKKDGVLTEEENSSPYTDLENAAMDGDSRKDFFGRIKRN